MKKILLITENLGSGGAERQLTFLAVLLKEKGYTVKVVTYVEKQFFEPVLKKHGVDYELHKELLNKHTRIFKLRNLFRSYKPDVIISYLSSVNISCCLANFAYGAKLLVSERSHTVQWNFKTKLKFQLYRFADYIVPNSFSEGDNIKGHCSYLQDKVVSIHNFIDTEYFSPPKNRPNNPVVRFLSVGRLIPSKNTLGLIKAVKELKERGCEFKLTWVGQRKNKEYVRKVEEEIKANNLEDYFILKDQTTNILEDYQNSDALCFPTFLEGFPNVLCEAMSCGLPILCSNVSDIPYMVEDGINGFVFNPYDDNAIVNAIIKYIDLDVQEKEKLGKNSVLKARKMFSKEIFINRYIELIEKL